MRPRCWQIVAASACLATAAASINADDRIVDERLARERYTAEWCDGARTAADEVRGWSGGTAQLSLAGRPLWSDGNSMRWLHDRAAARPPAPRAFIELVGGDRLPGRVIEFQPASDDSDGALPAVLVVEPHLPLSPLVSRLRVVASLVKCIVSRPIAGASPPATFVRRASEPVAFRSLRWMRHSVRLLLADGVDDVPLDELDELHLPAADPWDAYYREVAQLCPDGAGRLVRLETSDGLRLTTSLARLECRRAENQADQPENWRQRAQPVWCLEPLEVSYRSIRSWSSFAPHEVPLSRLDPAAGPAGGETRYRCATDANIEGGPLRAAGLEYGWGFGTHAANEFEFPLPAAARAFRSRLALDELAGSGGCARGRVLLLPGKQSLFESSHLIGSSEPIDTGRLSLGAPSGESRRLRLVADSAHAGRPAGADPLEIRDFVDWLEPMIELDTAELTAEARRRLPTAIAAWNGWQVGHAENFNVQADRPAGASAVQFKMRAAQGAPLTWSRTERIGPANDCLLLAVDRSEHDSSSDIEVLVDGRLWGRWPVPPIKATPPPPDPIVVYLRELRGREVTVSVRQTASDDRSWVVWRAMSLTPRPSRLFRLFEDDELAEQLTSGDGRLRLVRDPAYRGLRALALTGNERSNPSLPGLRLPIRYQPGPGEYSYLRFAVRSPGKRVAVRLAHDGQFGPDAGRNPPRGFAYDAGVGPPSCEGAVRVHDGNRPGEWTVVTRDLYADFGEFELTGLSLLLPDGGQAVFDHIYLARDPNGFRWIDGELDADRIARRLRRLRRLPKGDEGDTQHAARLVAAFAPGFRATDGTLAELAAEHRGERSVLVTRGAAAGASCRLSGTPTVPHGRKSELRLRVAMDEPAACRLVVRSNGITVHDAPLAAGPANDGWTDLAIDLSSLAGNKFGAAIEIEAVPAPGRLACAYWSRLDIVGR